MGVNVTAISKTLGEYRAAAEARGYTFVSVDGVSVWTCYDANGVELAKNVQMDLSRCITLAYRHMQTEAVPA